MSNDGCSLTSRDGFLDFSRGVCIFLVVWGHCVQYFSVNSFDFFDDLVFKIIYSFHMPLFMFLSGYVFYWSCSKRSLGSVIQKRLSGLLVPMVSWGGATFLINELFSAFETNNSPLRVTFRAFWAGNVFYHAFSDVFNIWFLNAVLEASFVVAVIYSSRLSKSIKLLAFFAGTIVLFFMPDPILCVYVYPYFVLGFLFCEYKVIQKNWFKYCVFTAVPLWCIMMLFFRKEHYIYVTGIYPTEFTTNAIIKQVCIDGFRYLIGFFGTIAVFCILYYAYRKCKHTKLFDKIAKTGEYSLQIYLIQRIVLEKLSASAYSKIVEKSGCNLLALNRVAYDFLYTPVLALIIVLLCCSIALAIKKIAPLNYCLFGRK